MTTDSFHVNGFYSQPRTETELLQVAIGIYHEVFEQFSKITLPEA